MPHRLYRAVYVLSLVLLLPTDSRAALAPGVAAQVVSLQGNGEQRHQITDSWVTTQASEVLPAGSFVRTLAASKMGLLFADDTQIRLNQNSVLQVKAMAQATPETTLLLSLGRAWAQTKRAPSSRLNFETPAATAGIRGTDWELDVDASGKTMLTVFSGSVDFFNAQGRLTVTHNEAAVAEVGKAPVKLLLSNPRERIQWVNALSADPLRHLDANQIPAAFQPALAALASHDLLAAQAALTQTGGADAGWSEIFRSTHAILAGDVEGTQQRLRALLGRPDQQPVPAYLLMSDLQLVAGAFDAAASTLKVGLTRWPDQPDLLAQLARSQMLADQLPESEKTLARAQGANRPSVLLAQGDLARRQGQTAATLRAFERMTQIAPDDDRGWYALGSAQNELEQSTPARANLMRSLALQPQGPGYQGELGTLETFANDFPKADQAFSTALTHNPADYVALTGLGLLRLKQGRPQEGLDAFLRAGLMEPRYARAKTYTAAAYYQLGRHQDALDTLQQATALDDKDPIPHLFLSQIFTDLLRPGEAVQASREAVRRLPYLKSLNQLANDQKGSANFGASLAFFGLEEWALELAQQSYYPYWGGSHLFLADRYPGEFNKNSELFQGYLSDPLAFGASNRFSSLLQRSGHYGMLEFNADKTAAELLLPSVTLNGLSNTTLPIAYFAQIQKGRANSFPIDVGVSSNLADFEDSSGRADVGATVTTLGLGIQVTERLGLFAYQNTFKVRLEGNNAVFDIASLNADQTIGTRFDMEEQQSALGLSYRGSPTSQTWLKLGHSQSTHDISAYPTLFISDNNAGILGVYAQPKKEFDDLQFRHTQDLGEATRLSVGLEHVRESQYSEVLAAGPVVSGAATGIVLSNYLLFGGTNTIERNFMALTLALQHRASRSWQWDATVAVNRMGEQVVGENGLIDVANQSTSQDNVQVDASQTLVAPRLGVVFQPHEQLSVRVAYQDWVRPLSVSTLNSVETAGIPLEDRFIVAGGRLKRSVLQVGYTPDVHTYLSAKLDHQSIHNPVAPGVDLRTPSLPFLEALRNAQNVNLSTLDVLEDIPDVEIGTLNALSLGVNHLMTSKLSTYLKYSFQDTTSSYADADAPSGRVSDQRIAFLPRHTLALGATWAGGQRTMVSARAIYRSDRFEDMQNLTLWPASWSIDLLGTWETQDKHWSIGFGALNLGGHKSARQFERYVVDARYRF